MPTATTIDRAVTRRVGPKVERSRRWPVRSALVGACVALAAFTVWGRSAGSDAPAPAGTIAFDGGRAGVAAAWVIGDPMASMHGSNQQYAATGMSMPQMLPDGVAEGNQRVAVQLALRAGDRTMRFPSDAMRLEADGRTYTPYRAIIGDESLRAGETVDTIVTFEVPAAIDRAIFRFHAGATAMPVSFTASAVDHDHDSAGTSAP